MRARDIVLRIARAPTALLLAPPLQGVMTTPDPVLTDDPLPLYGAKAGLASMHIGIVSRQTTL